MTTTAPRPAPTPPATPATPGLDAAALVGRLRTTFDSGRTRPLEWRLGQLQALRDALIERESELLEALAGDVGKPSLEAWATEVGFLLNEIDHVRKHLKRWTRPTKVRTPLATK
ncbi:MAG: aldehyde dehydrogenase family protein, partial [Acidimicrobiia bacterium]